MGIKGLMQVIEEEAPNSFKETQLKQYTGRLVAIDASMQLYQFMAMVRTADQHGVEQHLMNDAGVVTSHLQGFLNRTINLMKKGLKPVFVFDGKPPLLKNGELAKRRDAKAKAKKDYENAEKIFNETGDQSALDEMNKQKRRNIKVNKDANEQTKKLLRLMGVPIIEAPCEAEAQCAYMAQQGIVWAVGTEDMDALTFGTPILLRRLTMPESKKKPILEIHLNKLLKELDFTMEQFTDFCILCGCDYVDKIKGVGPKTALKLIRQHKNLETIFENINKEIPNSLKNDPEQIRTLFKEPVVLTKEHLPDLKFKKIDKEGLIKFLVGEMQFNQERVQNAIEKLESTKTNTSQTRIDNFFKIKKITS